MSVSAIILFSSAWIWKILFDMNIHKAGMLRFAKYWPTTFGEKQKQSSRSDQKKGIPLRKHTNKDTFRCLITIGAMGSLENSLMN